MKTAKIQPSQIPTVEERERVVFMERGVPRQYIKIIGCGDLDDDMLTAISDYVRHAKRRLQPSSPNLPESQSMSTLTQLRDEVERRLRAIVVTCFNSLSLSECRDTINYLDAQEYELALDCLCHGLTNGGRSFPPGIQIETRALAKMMDIDEEGVSL